MKFKLTECISLNKKFAVEFKISQEVGRSFAQLTGDCSSLHINSLFATTSAYRNNIAHGMLPILFIAAIPFDLKQGSFSILKSRISFFNPIFFGQKIRMEAEIIEINDVNNEFELEIDYYNSKTSNKFVHAKIILKWNSTEPVLHKKIHDEDKIESMLLDSLEENNYNFDQWYDITTDDLIEEEQEEVFLSDKTDNSEK